MKEVQRLKIRQQQGNKSIFPHRRLLQRGELTKPAAQFRIGAGIEQKLDDLLVALASFTKLLLLDCAMKRT
jgi:hypothetical protein